MSQFWAATRQMGSGPVFEQAYLARASSASMLLGLSSQTMRAALVFSSVVILKASAGAIFAKLDLPGTRRRRSLSAESGMRCQTFRQTEAKEPAPRMEP